MTLAKKNGKPMKHPKNVPFNIVKKLVRELEPEDGFERFLGGYINDCMSKPDPKVVRLLLQCGCRPEGWGPAGGHGLIDVLKVMLEFYNPRYRQPGDSISTGFSWACSHGHYKVASYLIENAKFKIAQVDHEEALEHARDRDHKKIVKLLESAEVKKRIHSNPNWD